MCLRLGSILDTRRLRMSNWLVIWLLLGGVIGSVWIVRLFGITGALRRRQVLSSHSHDGPPGDPQRVSVIVAAKDEEDNIESCLTTLLDQDYPDFEVIAVDDRSQDRTAVILKRLESTCGVTEPPSDRLRVITVRSLRDGWFGKNNAMHEGVAVSSGEWLCFTDADCRQISRKTLSMAMREAVEHNSDFLSVTPVLETRTVWERIIQPVCALVLIIWFLPERVNNPKTRTAYANGAFMLMRRSCYDAIGGHERVRTEINEDIHMARIAKQLGLKLRVVENDDLYRTRMYRTPAEAWRGWSRIFYGSLGSLGRLLTAAMLLIVFSLFPWISLAIALIGCGWARAGDAAWWEAAAIAWAGVILVKQAVAWRLYGVLRMGRVWSLTYVLGGAITLSMLVNAVFKTVGATSTTWRGTTYRGHHLADAEASQIVSSGTRHEQQAGRNTSDVVQGSRRLS